MFHRESGVFKTSYAADMALYPLPVAKWAVAAFAGLFIVIAPLTLNEYYISILNLILIACVGALGLNILVGYTGQISLGHAAFAMVGGFTVALMYDRWPQLRTSDYQLLLTVPAAGLTSTAVGTLFGVPSLRVKGLYLAIATFAAHPILQWVIEHLVPKLTVKGVKQVAPPYAIDEVTWPGTFTVDAGALTLVTLFTP